MLIEYYTSTGTFCFVKQPCAELILQRFKLKVPHLFLDNLILFIASYINLICPSAIYTINLHFFGI